MADRSVSAGGLSNSNQGVRGIRAMFEAKNETLMSPPASRGRSPAAASQSRRESSSSRPLSKVRANFVAVEKDGQLGLRKVDSAMSDTSAQDGGARVSGSGQDLHDITKLNGIKDGHLLGHQGADQSSMGETSKVNGTGLERPPTEKTSSHPDTTVGLSERGSRALSGKEDASVVPNLGTILKGSPFEEAPTGKEEKQPTTGKTAPATASKPAATKGPSVRPSQAKAGAQSKPAQAKPTDGKGLPSRQLAVNTGVASQSTSRPAASSRFGKSPKTPTTAASTSKASSPATSGPKAKPITKPSSRPSLPKATAPKEPTKPVEKKSSRASLATQPIVAARAKAAPTPGPSSSSKAGPSTASSSKPASPAATKTTKPSTQTTSPGGCHKPPPKSPTRPAPLPSHLTAPTAASAAKTGAERKVSGSHSDALKSATGSKPRGSRPSLGPPPATASARPASRTSLAKTPDDGFLARMMRPTASSASKVSGKAETKTTPPRKSTGARRRSSAATEKRKGRMEETVAEPMNGVNEDAVAEESAVGEPAEKEDVVETNGGVEAAEDPVTNGDALAPAATSA